MTDDFLIEHARRLWAAAAGMPVVFTGAAIDVAVSPESWLCPPGWAGIVVLGGAAIATAPDDRGAGIVRRAYDGEDLSAMRDRLPFDEALGPATLAYCDAAGFQAAGSPAAEIVPADHREVAALIARVPPEDAAECSLDEITSPAFVLRSGPDIVAAAGYRAWPFKTAHVSVLTDPAERGRGHARIVGSAAVAAALDDGLVPQWRARPEASRRVARKLGFRELGSQLSVRLRPS